MAESLSIIKADREKQHQNLLPQIQGLIEDETDLIANLANVSAALKAQFDWFWIGFYFVRGDELVVGPFQGPVACTRIAKGKGVCGTSWQKEQTVIVPDVNKYSIHIACNTNTKSEIVVPILKNGEVKAVLDIDSDQVDSFDHIDQQYLEKLVDFIAF